MLANVDVGMSLGMLIMVALMITLGVLTITVIIKRFSKNLLGDEGYLMMTLPVSAKKIVASKIITSVVYLILSNYSSIFSICCNNASFWYGYNERIYTVYGKCLELHGYEFTKC